MQSLIVYDSVYGNTERIAMAIGEALGPGSNVIRAGAAGVRDVQGIELLIVGTPTQGGRPTQPVRDFMSKIPVEALKGIKVAVFDTRVPARWVGIFGNAARRIASELEAKGAVLALPAESFIVVGTKGPVKEGELERAGAWAGSIAKT